MRWWLSFSTSKCEKINVKRSEMITEEELETAIFSIKQQVLSKPILLKPLQDKQRRLLALNQTVEQLNASNDRQSIVRNIHLKSTPNVMDWTKNYFEQKNALKTQFSNAIHPLDCVDIITFFLALEKEFAAHFEGYDWTLEQPVFGKELDAMSFIRFLQEQQVLGRKTLSELNDCKSELPSLFLLDLKRLSLLKNYL